MKKRFKKLAAIGLTCAMVVGMSITAGAEDNVVAPGHKHNYSYMGPNNYDGRDYGVHPYYYADEKGNTYVISCYVTLLKFRDVIRCGCGVVKYENYRDEYRHSVCGQ